MSTAAEAEQNAPGPWGDLTPPYQTIVADPPWHYDARIIEYGRERGRVCAPMPYSTMSVEEIVALPVAELAAPNCHLYLWTTNRYLRDAYEVAEAWGFRFSQVLVWCKPIMGLGPGGTFAQTTEYVLVARRGSLRASTRLETTWWQWSRGPHSAKPAAFGDLVEQVSPPPYVELFARAPRLGWDSWGYGYEAAS